MTTTRPIFCISDLHMGDKGPRDNFAYMDDGSREADFKAFLNYVEDCKGRLIIVGDLFELWQANMSKVLTCRLELLDRLARMDATYIVGNHDIDLVYFQTHRMRLSHPLLRNIRLCCTLEVAHRRIHVTHGHMYDPYCCDDKPGLGRISAIYTGMKEDRNKGPLMAGKYGIATVEARTLGRIGYVGSLVRRCLGRPSVSQIIRRNVYEDWMMMPAINAVIFGHTHEPGQFVHCDKATALCTPIPIYNSGTWAGNVNSFVRINPDGDIAVLNWKEGRITNNADKLELK